MRSVASLFSSYKYMYIYNYLFMAVSNVSGILLAKNISCVERIRDVLRRRLDII
jgi:hypothetical protein